MQEERRLMKHLKELGITVLLNENDDITFINKDKRITYGDWNKSYNKNVAILLDYLQEIEGEEENE